MVCNFILLINGDWSLIVCVDFVLGFNKLFCLFKNIVRDMIKFFCRGLMGGLVIWVKCCLK